MCARRAWSTVLSVLLTGSALAAASAPTAHAGEAVYRITEIKRAGFIPYDPGGPDLTRCRDRYDSDLSVRLGGVAENPDTDEDAYVTGLSVVVSADGSRLGKLRLQDVILREDGGHFAGISCREWTDLLPEGFGGPDPDYRFRIVGTGVARTFGGQLLGPVQIPSRAFDVRIPQLAKVIKIAAELVGDDRVRLSGVLRKWGARNGSYGWRTLRRNLVDVEQTYVGVIATVRSTRRGAFSATVPYTIAPLTEEMFVEFLIRRHSSDEARHMIDHEGNISPSCPEC